MTRGNKVALNSARRRLRRMARLHGCQIVSRIEVISGHRWEIFGLVDRDTGARRGELVTRYRQLTENQVDQLFAERQFQST